MTLSLNDPVFSLLGIGPAAAFGAVDGVETLTLDSFVTVANPGGNDELSPAGVPTYVAAQAMEVVSSAAADTLAGAGARQLRVSGLDADFLRVSATINMNGVTPVPLPGTWSVVERMDVIAVGATGFNSGTITARTVVGATGQCVIPAAALSPFGTGYSRSIGAHWGVPQGESAIVLHHQFAATPGELFVNEAPTLAIVPARVTFVALSSAGVTYRSADWPIGSPYASPSPAGVMFGGWYPERTRILTRVSVPEIETSTTIGCLLQVLRIRNTLAIQQFFPQNP